MKCTLKNEAAAVFDEVLDKEMFGHFLSYFNSLDFRFVTSSNWMKIWRVNDGDVLVGNSFNSASHPFKSPLDWLHHNVYNLAKSHMECLVGKEGEDWDEISYTPYIYGAGTKISWHDDTGYRAAAIFYCHPEWSPFWGGELMLANTPSQPDISVFAKNSDMVNRGCTSALLNMQGSGMYISPLPNRVAFTKTGVWHCINRVDSAAGDNLRCSFVAFFKKKS